MCLENIREETGNSANAGDNRGNKFELTTLNGKFAALRVEWITSKIHLA